MKSLHYLLLIVLIYGCKGEENGNLNERINTFSLRNLVTEAIDSSVIANNKLANLVDYSPDFNKNYNSVIVDSLITGSRTYYYVLLENPNPLHSRFAVYDSQLNPLLMDKSLNGNIFIENISASGKDFIRIEEAYLSKDTLKLNRLSLYLPDESGVSLVYRTHTKFEKPGMEYFQTITVISDTLIKTKISGSRRFALSNREDVFKYTPSERKYLSDQNLFDVFIKKEIENFNYIPVKKQVTK